MRTNWRHLEKRKAISTLCERLPWAEEAALPRRPLQGRHQESCFIPDQGGSTVRQSYSKPRGCLSSE